MRWPGSVPSAVVLLVSLALAVPEAGHAEETAATGPSAATEVSVTVRWKARHEKGVYGYLVYRAEDRAGPYRRVSERLVRVRGGDDPEQVNAYAWTDRDVEAGRRYYYYLDLVRVSGLKERFSGVVDKVAGEGDSASGDSASGADGID